MIGFLCSALRSQLSVLMFHASRFPSLSSQFSTLVSQLSSFHFHLLSFAFSLSPSIWHLPPPSTHFSQRGSLSRIALPFNGVRILAQDNALVSGSVEPESWESEILHRLLLNMSIKICSECACISSHRGSFLGTDEEKSEFEEGKKKKRGEANEWDGNGRERDEEKKKGNELTTQPWQQTSYRAGHNQGPKSSNYSDLVNYLGSRWLVVFLKKNEKKRKRDEILKRFIIPLQFLTKSKPWGIFLSYTGPWQQSLLHGLGHILSSSTVNPGMGGIMFADDFVVASCSDPRISLRVSRSGNFRRGSGSVSPAGVQIPPSLRLKLSWKSSRTSILHEFAESASEDSDNDAVSKIVSKESASNCVSSGIEAGESARHEFSRGCSNFGFMESRVCVVKSNEIELDVSTSFKAKVFSA